MKHHSKLFVTLSLPNVNVFELRDRSQLCLPYENAVEAILQNLGK